MNWVVEVSAYISHRSVCPVLPLEVYVNFVMVFAAGQQLNRHALALLDFCCHSWMWQWVSSSITCKKKTFMYIMLCICVFERGVVTLLWNRCMLHFPMTSGTKPNGSESPYHCVVLNVPHYLSPRINFTMPWADDALNSLNTSQHVPHSPTCMSQMLLSTVHLRSWKGVVETH